MTDSSTEIWKQIPDVAGYEASSLGRIRSVDRIVTRVRQDGRPVMQPYKGRVLSAALCKNGYLYVACGRRTRQVHRLVALAFLPIEDGGLDAAHKNNIRTDNRAENLCWKTRKDNISDQIKHGTRLRGEKQNGAKLTERDVVSMRSIRAERNIGWAKLGKMFSVAPMTAKNAVIGKTWGHIHQSQPDEPVAAKDEAAR